MRRSRGLRRHSERRGRRSSKRTWATSSYVSPYQSYHRLRLNSATKKACSFYAITENFIQCTRPALASHLSLPQRYYLPDRLRESYQPRLEAAGLWDVDVERTKKEKGPGEGQRRGGAASLLLREKVQQTFAKEKVRLTREQARFAFEEKIPGHFKSATAP